MQDNEQCSREVHRVVHPEWTVDNARFSPRPQYLLDRPAKGEIQADDTCILFSKDSYQMVWLEEGDYILRNEAGPVSQGNIPLAVLIPPGVLLHIQSPTSTTKYMVMSFRAHSNLCMNLCPSEDHRNRIRGRKLDHQNRPRRTTASITELPMSAGVLHWAASVGKYLQYGDVSVHMFDFKLQEFFLLLRLEYTKPVVDEFLRYYHCRMSGFRGHVISSYHPGMDVPELYKIGEEYKMNELAFKRSFVEEFGMPPRDWITLQRARYVYNDLINTSASIGEIGEQYGFCSMSYFSLFCKANLGGTPMQIRKSKGRHHAEVEE